MTTSAEVKDEKTTVSGHVGPVIMCRCSTCRKKIEQKTALVCMSAQMHNYVCSIKCMNDFYT